MKGPVDETKAADIQGYPTSLSMWGFLVMPQITIFVFIAVCVIATMHKGGPYGYLISLLPVLAANIYSLFALIRRSTCS